jgi:hypothetical protein
MPLWVNINEEFLPILHQSLNEKDDNVLAKRGKSVSENRRNEQLLPVWAKPLTEEDTSKLVLFRVLEGALSIGLVWTLGAESTIRHASSINLVKELTRVSFHALPTQPPPADNSPKIVLKVPRLLSTNRLCR